MTRARLLGIAILLALAAACERQPRWPVTYLLDLPGPHSEEAADIGAVQRPVLGLGLTRPVHAAQGEGLVPASRELLVPLALPKRWPPGSRVFLQTLVVAGTALRGETAETVASDVPPLTIRFAADEVGQAYRFLVTARVEGERRPPARTLGPVRIPVGARLETAVAIPDTTCASAPPTTLRIDAVARGRVRALHRLTLAPPRACGRWTRVSIPLDRVAGETVSLRFGLRRPRQRDPRVQLSAWVGDPTIVPPAAAGPRPPNLIVVSLDTLGARHLGTYGHPHPTTPFLDELATRGTTFERAYAQYPSTAASHMSLFTGKLVGAHGVRGLLDRLAPDTPLLAEELRRAGWTTAAVTENATLHRSMGFARGYSEYRENRGHLYTTPGLGRRTFRDALRWLRRPPPEPFFLFVHTYEVHSPYTPLPQHLRRVREADPALATDDPMWRYDAEVRLLDQLVARFWHELAARGLRERTVLVVTSDHGEAFGQHGEWAHGTTLHEEVMRVPLLISGPGVAADSRVVTPVGLVDLAPTLLEVAALQVPAGLQGRSLTAALRGVPLEPRPVLAELQGALGPHPDGSTPDQRAVWLDSDKVIRDLRRDAWLAFDLALDPDERHDVARERPELIAAARAQLDWYATLSPPAAPARPGDTAVSPGDVERLRALGYVE